MITLQVTLEYKDKNYNTHLNQSLEICLAQNQALINYVVKRFNINNRAAAQRITKEDLRSEAKLGFIVAFKNYNGTNAFSTYAYKTMYGYLQNMVNLTLSNGPAFPQKIRVLANKIKYEHPHEREEIKAKYKVTDRTLEAAYECLETSNVLFMSHKVRTNRNRRTASVETILGASDDLHMIEEEIMSLLTEREQKVLALKLEEYGATEIAAYIGVTRPMIYKDLKSIQEKLISYYAESGIQLNAKFKNNIR